MAKKSNKTARQNINNTVESEKNTPVVEDKINIEESVDTTETEAEAVETEAVAVETADEKTEISEEETKTDNKESTTETEQTETEQTEQSEDNATIKVDDSQSDKSVDTVNLKKDASDKESEKTVEVTDKKEEDKENKFTLHDLVWVTIGLVIGILLSYCIFNVTLNSAIQRLTSDMNTTTVVDNKEDSTEVLTGISTYEDPNRVISDADEIKEAQNLMNNYIDGITTGSTYSQVMTGEDQYVYYMYNSKGEIFTQDINATYTEVFLNDDRVFKYDTDEQTLSIGSDIDIASILRNAVSAIGNDNVTLYEMNLDDVDSPDGHEYRIDLIGEDAIKLLYTSVSDEFATDMVDSITESISDWEPHIIMVLFIGDNVEDSYGYCLYVIDDTEYTNWFFQGYDTVDDWTLDDTWYTYDAESDTEGETYTNLMNNLVEEVNNVMTSYADSKGWLSETIDTDELSNSVTESTETEEVESTEETESNN